MKKKEKRKILFQKHQRSFPGNKSRWHKKGRGDKEDEHKDEQKSHGAQDHFLAWFLFNAPEIEEISLKTYLLYLYFYYSLHLECSSKPKAITSANQRTTPMEFGSRISAAEEITDCFYNYLQCKKGFEMPSAVRQWFAHSIDNK